MERRDRSRDRHTDYGCRTRRLIELGLIDLPEADCTTETRASSALQPAATRPVDLRHAAAQSCACTSAWPARSPPRESSPQLGLEPDACHRRIGLAGGSVTVMTPASGDVLGLVK